MILKIINEKKNLEMYEEDEAEAEFGAEETGSEGISNKWLLIF